jgi:hypothetical protein
LAPIRLKYRVRAESLARIHRKEDLEKQIEALKQEAAKNSVQSEKQFARFLEKCRLCWKEVVDHVQTCAPALPFGTLLQPPAF